MNQFQKDLEIDKYALDTECMDQARRFMEWSEKLAEAIRERELIEQQMKVIEAQVETEIRQKAKEKITEANIKAMVTLDRRVQQIRNRYIEISYQVSILSSAKQALEHRKSMLESLVRLFLSGYWSEPKIHSEEAESLTQKLKTSDVLKDKLNKSLIRQKIK